MGTDKKKATKEWVYQIFILKILDEAGGKAETYKVIDKIGKQLESSLSEKDLKEYDSGNDIRWKNNVKWARQHLKENGFLRSDSPHGVWEITDAGRKLLKEMRELNQVKSK